MTLSKYRKKHGLTQPQAAKILNMNQGFLSQLETCYYNVSLTKALEIERLSGFEVRAEDLPLSAVNRREVRHLRVQMKALVAG